MLLDVIQRARRLPLGTRVVVLIEGQKIRLKGQG